MNTSIETLAKKEWGRFVVEKKDFAVACMLAPLGVIASLVRS